MKLEDLAPLLLRRERERGMDDALDVSQLTSFLRGGAELHARRRQLEALVAADPVLGRRDWAFLNHTQRYHAGAAKALRFVQLVRAHRLEDDPEAQQLLYAAVGERLPLDVHRSMFVPTLENQASPAQQREWLPRARRFRIIGAYAQTELGHGSNVQGIETTAHYDKTTQEFILNSPTLTSRKWWPGGLGKTATHAIVHARLLLDKPGDASGSGADAKRNAGVQAFIVPLRSLETHEPLPGIELGDIGPKVGFNAIDNGYCALHNVRVPRENMLMRFAQVLPDGTFVKPPSDKLVYLTMVQVRATLVLKLGNFLGSAATIVTRFSAARVQGRKQVSEPGGTIDEIQVLEYQNQQHALFPYIALSYAAMFAGTAMAAMHDRVLAKIQQQQTKGSGGGSLAFEAELAELHAVASGMKAWLADEVGVGIEALRRLCGGHGFAQCSNLPHLYAEIVGASTYEGTFDVLVQQHARFLVKNAPAAAAEALPSTKCGAQSPQDFGDVRVLLEAFRVRALRATCRVVAAMDARKQLQRGGGDISSADSEANPFMVLMTRASVAHSEHRLLLAFADGLETIPATSAAQERAKAAVADLCALLGVWLLVRSLGDFRDGEYVSSAQGEMARSQLLRLLPAVRRNAVLLTDAWDFSDLELSSTIGRHDGDIYRALVARAQDEPLNRTQVAASYEQYLKPLIQSSL